MNSYFEFPLKLNITIVSAYCVSTPYVCKLKNHLLNKFRLGRGVIFIVRMLVIFYQAWIQK
jgi:hypothetical protein